MADDSPQIGMASALLPWRPEVVDLASDSSKSSKAGAACGSDNGWRRARQEEASGWRGHGWEEGGLRTRPGGRMQAEAGARTGGRRDAAAGREQASAAMGEGERRASGRAAAVGGRRTSEGTSGEKQRERREASGRKRMSCDWRLAAGMGEKRCLLGLHTIYI